MNIYVYKNINILFSKDSFFVYLNRQLFYRQLIIKSGMPKNLSNKQYTLLYVFKVLSNFGLIPSIKRSFK